MHNQSEYLKTKPHLMVLATQVCALSLMVEVYIEMLKKVVAGLRW